MDRPPLGLPVHIVVLFPAVAVPHHLVSPADDLRPHLGVALQGQGAGEDGRVDAILVQQIQNAPDADPAAILEERLVGQVSLTPGHRRRRLTNRLAVSVAVQDGVLRPLLVVDYKGHGDACAVGPFNRRRVGAIADQVASCHEITPRGPVSRPATG